MVDADHLRDASPWHPMKDAVDLKHLGKLAEEMGEAVAAISRCIIQGINEHEPVTGKVNREWLEDELADVWAGMNLCCQHFGLDVLRMIERKRRKEKHLRQWHEMA